MHIVYILNGVSFNTVKRSFLFLSQLNKDKKTPNQVEFIRKALKKNVFLKVLDANQVDQLINCMTQMSYSSGSNVVTEGEYGSHLFVIETGKVSRRTVWAKLNWWLCFATLVLTC